MIFGLSHLAADRGADSILDCEIQLGTSNMPLLDRVGQPIGIWGSEFSDNGKLCTDTAGVVRLDHGHDPDDDCEDRDCESGEAEDDPQDSEERAGDAQNNIDHRN
ncbi:hypothetical protein, partial [Nocardia lijiangensis]|uniref:hypothetical protein n=1 Tax=Nocardia lijiangensis TaxID=299618 RepID=UPI0012DCF607